MPEYRIAVQCDDAATGRTADFIRTVEGETVSPLFTSLADLFPWMRSNGFKLDEDANGRFIPWRVTKM